MSGEGDYEDRMSLAAASGDALLTLTTLRDMLAERFDRASPRDSAGLARQIQLIMADIQKLQSGEEIGEDRFAEALLNWEPK